MAVLPRAPPSRAKVLDAAQDHVQTMLQLTADLCRALDRSQAAGVALTSQLTREDAAKMLQQYSANLCNFDQYTHSLSRLRVPLEAVQHLDKSGLALEPWCKGLAGRLRIANERARACVAPLDIIAAQLYSDGWASTSSSSSGSSMKASDVPGEVRTLQPHHVEAKSFQSTSRGVEDKRQAGWAAALALDDGDGDSQEPSDLDKDERVSSPARKDTGQVQTLCQGPLALPVAIVKQPSELPQACHIAGLQRNCHPQRSLESTPTPLSPQRRQTQAESERMALLASERFTGGRTTQNNDLKGHDALKRAVHLPSEASAKTAGQARSPTWGRAEEHAPAGGRQKKRIKIMGLAARR